MGGEGSRLADIGQTDYAVLRTKRVTAYVSHEFNTEHTSSTLHCPSLPSSFLIQVPFRASSFVVPLSVGVGALAVPIDIVATGGTDHEQKRLDLHDDSMLYNGHHSLGSNVIPTTSSP